MQEYNDGSFGEIQKGTELLKKLAEDTEELNKTKAVHFGTEDDLRAIKNKTGGAFGSTGEQEDKTSVKEYLRSVNEKLDMIIKHFNIVHIVGEDK